MRKHLLLIIVALSPVIAFAQNDTLVKLFRKVQFHKKDIQLANNILDFKEITIKDNPTNYHLKKGSFGVADSICLEVNSTNQIIAFRFFYNYEPEFSNDTAYIHELHKYQKIIGSKGREFLYSSPQVTYKVTKWEEKQTAFELPLEENCLKKRKVKQLKQNQMLELEGLNEYNNSGALLGLDAVEHEELLGALKRMNPIQRMKVMNKLAGGVPASKGSRAEMEKHFHELPQHIKDGLLKGDLRLADTIIYSRKQVNSKTVKLFETQDVKEVGIRNISNAKLPKNQALLVSGIFLLAATAENMTSDKIIAAKYDKIEDYAAIANGEFTLKANKKIIMTDVDNAIFKTNNNHAVPIGYYKLANPRMIQDDILLEATVELGSLDGIDTAKTVLYVGLHGTITTP